MTSTRALVLLLAACGGSRASDPPPPVAPPLPPPTAQLDAPSIYDLPIRLQDASGTAIDLGVARGRPVLISMFYASCPVACPALIDELARTLGEAPSDVQVVLVSFDPARDTPAKLRELATTRGLDARWTLAAPSDGGERELAALLGIKYRRLDSGEFFHSSTIVALDREGRPIARANGLGQHDVLISALAGR